MMGMFHMLIMCMHILSKRFANAGVRDVLIQSGVIAEGSVDIMRENVQQRCKNV